MSETWRNLPRKRVLVPGSAGGGRFQSRTPPAVKNKKRRAQDRANAKRQRRMRHALRAQAAFEESLALGEKLFAAAVLHGLERMAIEAARPAPVAVDRET